MKTVDFWFLKRLKTLFAVAAVLVFCATTATAGPVEPETGNQPAELVLTLSDQWSAFDTADQCLLAPARYFANCNRLFGEP